VAKRRAPLVERKAISRRLLGLVNLTFGSRAKFEKTLSKRAGVPHIPASTTRGWFDKKEPVTPDGYTLAVMAMRWRWSPTYILAGEGSEFLGTQDVLPLRELAPSLIDSVVAIYQSRDRGRGCPLLDALAQVLHGTARPEQVAVTVSAQGAKEFLHDVCTWAFERAEAIEEEQIQELAAEMRRRHNETLRPARVLSRAGRQRSLEDFVRARSSMTPQARSAADAEVQRLEAEMSRSRSS
jgi:hypothetical protein